MIRVVVDTSVFVSALIGRPDGAPARVVVAAAEGRVQLVVSPLLLDELGAVLARPRFAALGDERRQLFIAALTALAEHHDDPPAATTYTADPKDDYLVALAIAAKADALVSLDGHLLAPHRPVQALRPAALLERLT